MKETLGKKLYLDVKMGLVRKEINLVSLTLNSL